MKFKDKPNFFDLISEKYQRLQCKCDEQEKALQSAAKAIQAYGKAADIEQPYKCLFYGGDCGYPIDACYECPCHSWSDDPYIGMTRAVIE